MILSGISLLGWVHTLACLVALPVGAYVLIARKGTRRHRLLGWIYAVAMLLEGVTVLAIYRFDIVPGQKPGPGHFGFFHVSALTAIAAVLLAVYAASRQRKSRGWAQTHAQALLFTYYLLIGGLINELVARVTLLHVLATRLSPHAASTAESLLAQGLQTGVMLIWWGLIPLFAGQVARRFRTSRALIPTITYPMRYSGGAFVAWLGICILFGAFWHDGNHLGMVVAAGVTSGALLLRIARRASAAVWGVPSRTQNLAFVLGVGLELSLFMALGISGFFQRVPPVVAAETAFAVVAVHFLVLRWSHGPLMLRLGLSVLAWLGVSMVLRLPLPLVAIGDGLIMLGFGLAMVEPWLVRAGYFPPVVESGPSPLFAR